MTSVRSLITRDYVGALRRGDVSAYVGLFTEDAFWAPPGAKPAHGRAHVSFGIKELFEAYAFDVEIKPLETEVFGQNAWVVGRVEGSRMPREEGKPAEEVRSTAVWLLQRRPSGWRISHVVWNEQ